MSEKENLPNGWVLTTIPSLIAGGVFTDGDWVESKDQDPQGSVRLLQLADIGDGFFINKSNRFLNEETANYLNCTYLKSNDVLVARMPDPLGRACLMPKMEQASVTVVDVCVIRPAKFDHFNTSWLMYFINSPEFRGEIAALQSGSTRKRISRGNLSKIEFPFPPRLEQDRLVDKLEELFCDLDAGIKELKAAQIKLSQYRQSLLKSAVEGSLTRQWREENSSEVQETGEQLLARILKQRREQWQQQKLAEFNEKGKTPPKGWMDKYPEPVLPDISGLPKLPQGWVWASMSQICKIQGGIQKQPKRRPIENKYPFLRVANVYRNELRLKEVHEIELFGDELQRFSLIKGDILIVEGNGSKSEIGRCAIWNNEIENAVHQNHLIRSRPIIALSRYMALWLNSPAGMDIMSTLAVTTSGLYTLSVSKVSKIPVPIPPLLEQKAIADEVDTEFDSIDRQIEATALGLKQSEAQRKNILKSAFSGRLVSQDPNDEPASVLLEKIKLEREALAKTPKLRTPRKPKEKVDVMNTLLEVLTTEDRWIDAQEAFRKCGIVDGTSTDRVEEIYAELRKLEKAGKIEIERNGGYDQFQLITQDVKEN